MAIELIVPSAVHTGVWKTSPGSDAHPSPHVLPRPPFCTLFSAWCVLHILECPFIPCPTDLFLAFHIHCHIPAHPLNPQNWPPKTSILSCKAYPRAFLWKWIPSPPMLSKLFVPNSSHLSQLALHHASQYPSFETLPNQNTCFPHDHSGYHCTSTTQPRLCLFWIGRHSSLGTLRSVA